MISIGSEKKLVFCLTFCLSLISKKTYKNSITVERVKIKAESFGNKKPKTVLLKTGLISGGIDALIVRMKKETGHSRWVSTTNKIFLILVNDLMCGVIKNFFRE